MAVEVEQGRAVAGARARPEEAGKGDERQREGARAELLLAAGTGEIEGKGRVAAAELLRWGRTEASEGKGIGAGAFPVRAMCR